MYRLNYPIRTYRKQFNIQRFKGFNVIFRETDLWIGVDSTSFREGMKEQSLYKIKKLRENLDEYILKEPQFAKSLIPFHPADNAPTEAMEMAQAAQKAGIGPLASVAGLFAREVGETLLENFPVKELVIENGGDIFAVIKKELVFSIFAGKSTLSGKIGLVIPAETGKLGICTSAGTVGPSLSFGKADAVVVICKNVLLADAFATTLGNKVKTQDDIEKVLKFSKRYPEILSALIISEDIFGVQGGLEVKMIR